MVVCGARPGFMRVVPETYGELSGQGGFFGQQRKVRRMSERDRPRSPLESERGRTRIKDGVVSKIAGVAAGEVEGILMGGSVSRAAGSVLGSVTGSRNPSQGISVQVGRTETAIDVTMGIEYGGNILQLAEMVRSRIAERVESLTGLRVKELNVTVSDVVFPEGVEEGRGGGLRDEDRPPAQQEVATGSLEREAAGTESIDLGAARSQAITRAGGRFRDEIRAEDTPPEEDETAELRLDDEETERRGQRREE